MAEHLGSERWRSTPALHGLLVPGGRLLNHQIFRRPGPGRPGRTFIGAFVFPDGELLPLSDVVGVIEGVGFEVRDVEACTSTTPAPCGAGSAIWNVNRIGLSRWP